MNYLRSKFGRRLVLLFVCCAFVPIAVLAIVSFSHVRQQLKQQSQQRLFQATKNLGMTIYERLLVLEAEMGFVAAGLSHRGHGYDPTEVRELRQGLAPRFSGLTISRNGRELTPLVGKIENPPQFSAGELKHLRSGKTLVSGPRDETLPTRVFMSRAVKPQEPERGILVGEINPQYVFGIGDYNALPPLTGLCVLDQFKRILICTEEGSITLKDRLITAMESSPSAQFQWSHDGEEYFASSWLVPMKFKFLTPHWTVVLSELKSDVFAPMANFSRIFPFVVLLSLLVVLLVSVRQIRRSVVPLQKLKAGTRRIARRDFASPVKVKSGDEFEELSESFNAMAARLGRQFETLATMAEIDRAILSSLDAEKIVETVLARLRDVFPSDFVNVTLFDEVPPGNARIYSSNDHAHQDTLRRSVHLVPDDVMPLFRDSGGICVADGKIPDPLGRFVKPGIQSLMVLPILRKEGLAGWVALGHVRAGAYSEEDMIQVRQLADQVAVALSNASYIEERRRAKEELQSNLQRLVALRDIDQAVTSTLDLNTILDFLLRKIDLLLPHSATSVWLVQKAHDTPMPVAHRNLNSANWYKEELDGWGGVPNPVFETRAMAHVRNLQNRDGLQHQEFFHKNQLVTYLGVPLIAKGEFLGALSVYLKEDYAFSGEEVDFFSTLAGQVAVAIYNSRLYEEMKTQAESLARANRVKSEFLSVMSHELRTPLTIIMSFTESMQEGIFGALTEKQKESLKKVSKQSNHLLTMINTLMETTGLEAEVIKVEIEPFSLHELFNEVRATYNFPLQNGVTLNWEVPSDPLMMTTDRRRIKLIVQHLIDNAIKFTDEGQVTISAGLNESKDRVELKVADTGIGIPTEALPVIFDKLVQWDSSETRSYGGVGLGLYVVKSFAELLKGRVEVNSRPGEGSTFIVTVPVEYHGANSVSAAGNGHHLNKRKAVDQEPVAGLSHSGAH